MQESFISACILKTRSCQLFSFYCFLDFFLPWSCLNPSAAQTQYYNHHYGYIVYEVYKEESVWPRFSTRPCGRDIPNPNHQRSWHRSHKWDTPCHIWYVLAHPVGAFARWCRRDVSRTRPQISRQLISPSDVKSTSPLSCKGTQTQTSERLLLGSHVMCRAVCRIFLTFWFLLLHTIGPSPPSLLFAFDSPSPSTLSFSLSSRHRDEESVPSRLACLSPSELTWPAAAEKGLAWPGACEVTAAQRVTDGGTGGPPGLCCGRCCWWCIVQKCARLTREEINSWGRIRRRSAWGMGTVLAVHLLTSSLEGTINSASLAVCTPNKRHRCPHNSRCNKNVKGCKFGSNTAAVKRFDIHHLCPRELQRRTKYSMSSRHWFTGEMLNRYLIDCKVRSSVYCSQHWKHIRGSQNVNTIEEKL